MYTIFTILITKIIIKIGQIVGRGSSLPGQIALKMNKKILTKIKLPKTVIAVTGSSGKGSTSSLIAKTLRELGYKVVHNSKGSNLEYGIATLLLENCTLNGKLKQDYLVYEVDERYTKYVFKNICPTHIIITNITRDQPPRQGNVDIVMEDIKNAIPKSSHIILNSDSPYMYKIVKDKQNKVSYYGVGRNEFSYKKNEYESLNIYYCPECKEKLEYEFYNFEENGNYKCSKCEYKRPKVECETTNINFEKREIEINNKYILHIETDLLFNIYNTLAAFTLLKMLEVDLEKSINIISNLAQNKKIYSKYEYSNKMVYVLNNKNENATTFNQSLNFLNHDKSLKTVLIGWKEISRRYEFNDVSWLYDVEFEILKEHEIDNIVCVGNERYDIATRIKLAGIEEDKIKIFKELEEAVSYIKEKTKGDIYSILNFDYVEPFNKCMKGEKA